MPKPIRPPVFSRRSPLAPGRVQNAAARWSDAMRYPRELTDDAATGAADAYAAEHAAPVMPTREAFVAAAGRARLAIAALALVDDSADDGSH